MRKHRKKTHRRKIVVAVGALAIVGVPTAAMACFDTQEGGWSGRPTAARHDANPWRGAPLGLPGTRQPVESPVPTEVPTAPAEPTTQPVVETPPPAPQPKPKPKSTPAKPPVATPAPTAPAASSPAPTGAAAEVLALVNQERAAAGCPALTVNAKLTKAAQDHSADMAAHNTMSHTGSDGSDPGARITRAGYTWSTYGENVAYGYGTAAKVMEGWMNSPGHRANILNCSFKEIGIGHAQPGDYWTQDFGAAR
ncbi:CAP domain-containing protein [Streptomyces sp. NPDC048337]|uniref:CAP domain-containing protein n=1 Tax=Streptomyces sp. NPDC048337 TaxID=3365535 RepID=UPI00371CDFDA